MVRAMVRAMATATMAIEDMDTETTNMIVRNNHIQVMDHSVKIPFRMLTLIN